MEESDVNIGLKPRKVKMAYSFLVNAANLVFSMIIATPLTIIVWRGVWGYLNYSINSPNRMQEGSCRANGNINCSKAKGYLTKNSYTEELEDSNCRYVILLLVALVLRLSFQVCQSKLECHIRRLNNIQGVIQRFICATLSYMYIVINTIVSVSLWYTLWQIMDKTTFYLTTVTKCSTLAFYCEVLAVVLAISFLCNAFCDMIACPLVLQFDRLEDIFGIGSFSPERRAEEQGRWDLIFSLLRYTTISFLTVVGWWSIWSILDFVGNHNMLRLDANSKMSEEYHVLWDSIAIGYSICGLVYTFYSIRNYAGVNNEVSIGYKFYNDVIMFSGFCGCILTWRGLWSFFHVYSNYIVQEEPQNFLFTAAIAGLLLIICGCFNTSTSRGNKGFEINKYVNGKAPTYEMTPHPLIEQICKSDCVLGTTEEKDHSTLPILEMYNITDNSEIIDEQENVDVEPLSK